MSESKSAGYFQDQINQIVSLINAGRPVISESEKKLGEKMISIFVAPVSSNELRALQVESLVRAIKDLSDGLPNLKDKVMGLAMQKNTPVFFSEDSPQAVKGSVVVSARLQPEFSKSLRPLDQFKAPAEDEVMPAIFLCITHIASIKKKLASEQAAKRSKAKK
jgi:hypothetical protein